MLPNQLPKSPKTSDPQDTGAARFERLLAEAAVEAATKQLQLCSTLIVPDSAEASENSGKKGRLATETTTTASPPDVVGDNYQPSD